MKSTMDTASGGHGFPPKPYSKDIIPFLDEIFEGKTPSELITWANTLIVKPKEDEKPKSS